MLDDFEKLKREVENLQARCEREKGAREELLKRLKKEFGVETIEDAERLLKELKDQELASARRYTKRKNAFTDQFRKKLKEIENA